MSVALQPNMVMANNQARLVVLSPAQSAMVKTALMQYGGKELVKAEKPEPTFAGRNVDNLGQQAPGDVDAQRASNTERELGAQTLDSSVRQMIDKAVASFRSGGNESFAEVMLATLEAHGVDSSQSFVDFYA